jgi:xanthine dehydrogenase YagS FAD-binding subunit
MTPFALEQAGDIAGALAAGRAGYRYIAGGTTLVDLMREGVENPGRLASIEKLPLREIGVVGGELRIGALARMAEVAAHADVLQHQPLISQALVEGASPQLRNMASIGGNLLQRTRCSFFRMTDTACNKRNPGAGCAAVEGLHRNHAIFGTSEQCFATHASDLAVALVALDAVVATREQDGARAFPLEQLYRLPEATPHLEHTLRPGELITHVTVPLAGFSGRTSYVKVRDRASYEFAVVSVAAALDLREGRIHSVRLAAGGVGTVPWRLRAVEEELLGRTFEPQGLRAVARRASDGARPARDNAFKPELLPRVVVRALENAGGIA